MTDVVRYSAIGFNVIVQMDKATVIVHEDWEHVSFRLVTGSIRIEANAV